MVIFGWFLANARDRIDHEASFVCRKGLGKLLPRQSAWRTAVWPCSSCHRRDNGHLTCRMCALIAGLLLKTERVGDAGVGAKAAGWPQRKQHYVTHHPQSTPLALLRPHRPYFTASNWTGQPPLAARPPLGLPCLF